MKKMADDNQVGVVGRSQMADPAQAPQRGMPGVPQPPRPTPEETQRVIQLQKQRLAAEAQEAARRAAELSKAATSGHGMQLPPQQFPPQQQIPSDILDQLPPQMATAEWMRQPPQAPSQGIDRGQASGNQFERRSDPSPTRKVEIPWFPIRGKGVSIELNNSIIKNLPEKGMTAEGDAAARVVLALFDEILCLRETVRNLENFIKSGGAGGDPELQHRVYKLEMVLFEQRRSMTSRARAVREQVEILQAKGLSPDEIIQSLQDQATQAESITLDQSGV